MTDSTDALDAGIVDVPWAFTDEHRAWRKVIREFALDVVAPGGRGAEHRGPVRAGAGAGRREAGCLRPAGAGQGVAFGVADIAASGSRSEG